ncbi:uncharacterized protein LOC122259011 [Penaeus japonicus]|uniref:uncharacterized protein LOC122259011 n=1 Tax=Penaeus japonicus TaxID=27405 RepID=UPI001C70DB2E|nr:uncharacterized protein LOC122259011 [Penaeus japonicus]
MWSCLIRSLLITVLGVVAMSHANKDISVYKRMFYDAEFTWDDPVFSSVSWMGCSTLCRNTRCFAWSWSPEDQLCSVHSTFSPTSITYPANPSSHTYILLVGEEHDHLVFPVVEQTWDEASDLCQSAGAVLAYRNDKDWMKELKELMGVPGFFLGLRRLTIDDPWYDQLGNLVSNSSIFFSVTEPSDGPYEMCSGLWTTVNDLRCDTGRDLAALCQFRN